MADEDRDGFEAIRLQEAKIAEARARYRTLADRLKALREDLEKAHDRCGELNTEHATLDRAVRESGERLLALIAGEDVEDEDG